MQLVDETLKRAEKHTGSPPMRLNFRSDNPLACGARHKNGHVVASFQDTDFVINDFLKATNLTPSKLARLLGLSTANCHQWFSGAKSPSHAYLVRFLHLATLAATGINLLEDVRTLDWSTTPYRIEYWPGHSPEELIESSKLHRQVPR